MSDLRYRKKCMWCNTELDDNKKDFCNFFCRSNHFDMHNISVSRVFLKSLLRSEKKEQIEMLKDYSKKQKVDLGMLIKKIEPIREAEKI